MSKTLGLHWPEGYCTTPFKDSLNSQTWLFSYRNFAGPSTIFKFSHIEQIWGLLSIYWAFLRVMGFGNAVHELSTIYQGKVSSDMKLTYPNLWKSEKNYFRACTQGDTATICWMVKVKVMLYHCCVILLRFDNFLSAQKIL